MSNDYPTASQRPMDELNALRMFWDKLYKHFSAISFEIDWQDFLDIGEDCGLLMREVYEPEGKHEGLSMVMTPDPGDEVLVPSGLAKRPKIGDEG